MMGSYRISYRAVIVGLFTGVLVANSATAQEVQPQVLERFGGVWSSDCNQERSAPRLTISANTLVFEIDGARVIGENALSGYAMFGQMPAPEGFIVGLLSSTVEVYAYGSAQGDYLSILKVGGHDTRALPEKLIDCNAERRALSVSLYEARQAGIAAAEAREEAMLSDPNRLQRADTLLERDPVFRRAWLVTIGSLASDPWLTSLEGPGTESSLTALSGVEYQQLNGCKPRDCGDNNFVALYDRNSGTVYGLLRWRGQAPVLLGNPPPALADTLHELWSSTWNHP